MRQIISISLPDTLAKEIKKSASKRGFPSLSSYLQHLYIADMDNMISETELLEVVRRSRDEYKNGRFLKAKSLADLV